MTATWSRTQQEIAFIGVGDYFVRLSEIESFGPGPDGSCIVRVRSGREYATKGDAAEFVVKLRRAMRGEDA